MIVYWVALIQIAVYLCSVPMHVAVCLRLGSGARLCAGIAAFDGRAARERAMQRLRNGGGKKSPAAHGLSGKLRLLLRLIPRTRRARLRVRGCFSAGDACRTALLSGGINALAHAVGPFFAEFSVSVTPDFSASISYADIDGMITLSSGQIILAALSGAFKNTTRRISQWISTRSKAS